MFFKRKSFLIPTDRAKTDLLNDKALGPFMESDLSHLFHMGPRNIIYHNDGDLEVFGRFFNICEAIGKNRYSITVGDVIRFLEEDQSVWEFFDKRMVGGIQKYKTHKTRLEYFGIEGITESGRHRLELKFGMNYGYEHYAGMILYSYLGILDSDKRKDVRKVIDKVIKIDIERYKLWEDIIGKLRNIMAILSSDNQTIELIGKNTIKLYGKYWDKDADRENLIMKMSHYSILYRCRVIDNISLEDLHKVLSLIGSKD